MDIRKPIGLLFLILGAILVAWGAFGGQAAVGKLPFNLNLWWGVALLAFGGGGTGVDGTPSEGEWNRTRAIGRGVPADRALCGPAARYTSDESEGIAAALRVRGVRRIIVCTSAMHMPRALRNYRNLGFEATALPADFATRGESERFSPLLLIPRGLALSLTDSWAKERLGMLATPEVQAGETESAEPSSR